MLHYLIGEKVGERFRHFAENCVTTPLKLTEESFRHPFKISSLSPTFSPNKSADTFGE